MKNIDLKMKSKGRQANDLK